MANTEERLQILKMIEEGKITAKEGAELLRAVDQGDGGDDAESRRGQRAPRWFRVRVTDTASGKNKVNVNIPMGLVNVGMKMGARFAPNVEGVDMNQLLEAIRAGRQGKVIDITDEGERVEVFIE